MTAQVKAGDPASPRWGMSGFYACVIEARTGPCRRYNRGGGHASLTMRVRRRVGRDQPSRNESRRGSDRCWPRSPIRIRRVHFLERLRRNRPPASNASSVRRRRLRYADRHCFPTAISSEAILRYPEWCCRWPLPATFIGALGGGVSRAPAASFWARAGVPSPLDLARFRRRQLLRILLRDVLGWPRCPMSPRSCPTWPTPFSMSPTGASARSWSRATASPVWTDGTPVRLLRDLARQAGRQGAELQLRYRPDVRLRRQRRDRRRRRASPTRNSSRRSPTSTPSCSPPTPRRACATAWTCGCGPTARSAKSASRSMARAILQASAAATGNCRC